MRLLHWNIPHPRTPTNLDRVVIPLEDAHLHSHAARTGGTSPDLSNNVDDDVEDDAAAGKSGSDEGTGMLEMSVSEYSIEGLRREIRQGSRGELTVYERMLLTFWDASGEVG